MKRTEVKIHLAVPIEEHHCSRVVHQWLSPELSAIRSGPEPVARKAIVLLVGREHVPKKM